MLTTTLKHKGRCLLSVISGCLFILAGNPGNAQQTPCNECRQVLEEMARQTTADAQPDRCPDCRERLRQLAEAATQQTPPDTCSDCRELLRQLAEAAKAVAWPDVYTVPKGATLSISAPGVLENDLCPPGATCTVRLGTQRPQNGDLTAFNRNGSFSYTGTTPGTDQFTYVLTLGDSGVGEKGMVTVRVTETAYRNTRRLKLIERLHRVAGQAVKANNGNVKPTEKSRSGQVQISIEVNQESGAQ